MGKRILAKKGRGVVISHYAGLIHNDERKEVGCELTLTACGYPGNWVLPLPCQRRNVSLVIGSQWLQEYQEEQEFVLLS